MINSFFWLFVFAVPLIIFSAKPQANKWSHIGKLFVCVIIGHSILAYGAVSYQEGRMQKYYECRGGTGGEYIAELHSKCIAPIDDTFVPFYTFLGWLPAMGYVGILEIIWRIKHRKAITQLGKNYKGKWISNIVIGVAVFIFIIYPLCAIGSWLILSIINYL